jgi:transposase
MISKWKQDFLSRSSTVFEKPAPKDDFNKEKERLYAKIGQLEMERDWLKKTAKRLGL